ncbi:peptidase MA family metallohydrolase [Candidatus Moduliflexota bacterium]
MRSLLAAIVLAACLPSCPAAAAPAAPSLLSEAASLRSGPVTVLHAPADRALAGRLARRAAGIHERIREDLGLEKEIEVTVLLLTDRLPDAVTRPYDDPLETWIAGAAWSGRKFIVLRLKPGGEISEQERLLAHELTHVILQGDYALDGTWPQWFQEGLAMRESGGEGFRQRATLSFAALRGRILPLESISSRFPDNEAESRLAYAQSFSVISFLHAGFGRHRFRLFMDELRRRPFDDAFRSVYGMGTGRMEKEWRRFVQRRYNWIPLLTGATTFWTLTLLIFFLALGARRRKDRLLREKWEEEERPPRRTTGFSGGEDFPEE